MQKFSLEALARNHLERAAEANAGRSASTVYGGHEHVLRQTVIALAAGATRLAFQPSEHFHVFADPAGHPFCLTTHDVPETT